MKYTCCTNRRHAQPETREAARGWGNRKTNYLNAGLCHACAAQAAYGHQLGFSHVRPPCGACQPLVDAFDVPAVNGWRTLRAAFKRGAPFKTAPVTVLRPEIPAGHSQTGEGSKAQVRTDV